MRENTVYRYLWRTLYSTRLQLYHEADQIPTNLYKNVVFVKRKSDLPTCYTIFSLTP